MLNSYVTGYYIMYKT